jgi:NTE family protein
MTKRFITATLLTGQTVLQFLVLGPANAQLPNPIDNSPPAPAQNNEAVDAVPQPAAPETTGGMPQAKATNGRPRIALVLAGGGARGAAHIGVLKVMEREGIPVDFIAGASIGAVIGSLYSAGLPVRDIERLALNGELGHAFFPKPLWMKAAMNLPAHAAQRLLGLKPQVGLYSGRTIKNFVNKHVPANQRQIENLKTPFAAIGVNLLDTKPVWITSGDVGTAAQASSTVPMFYRPITVDGKRLMDGGVRTNLPTNAAQSAGADFVIAVRLHSKLDYDNPDQFKSFMRLADRTMSILMAEIEQKAIANADIIIEPDVDDATSYSFDREHLVKSIRAGEVAAEAALAQFKSKLAAASQRM